MGKGVSSRLFFNEQPQVNWLRTKAHIHDADAELYNFTTADVPRNIQFGMDTSTQEGREKFKAMWDDIHALAPEVVTKESFAYPHEAGKQIPTEAHFQRLWGYYREHTLKA